jgi:hypothetical protein
MVDETRRLRAKGNEEEKQNNDEFLNVKAAVSRITTGL